MSELAAPFRRVGPYLVLQLSGAGGMGRVDVVLSTRPGGFTKVCVLKRMLPELRSPEQEARFRREASIALRMSHGAIAQTLDVEEIDGELCLLQEFVHGTNLAYLEQRAAGSGERLPVPLVLHVASEIARALAYAHSFEGGGVIHRDVTPDNIMLSFSGEAKLVDFGIAKSVVEQPLTEVGMVVGRPLYTAPEVLAGREADARADVYSLGVVLWQALSGETFPDLLPGAANVRPPSSANPAVSTAVDAIVSKAVAVRPEDRFQRAEDLQEALAGCVPHGYLASKELATFLARHFNVDRERRGLAEDIEMGRRILAAEQELRPPTAVSDAAASAVGWSGGHPRLRRRVAPLIGVGLVLAAVIAGGWRANRRPSVVHHTDSRPLPLAPPPGPSPAVVPPSRPPVSRVAEVSAPDHNFGTRRTGRSTDHPGPTRNSAALLRDADRSFKSGDLTGAMALARQAAHEGAGGGAHLMMGKIFYARNQLAEAEAEFERARQASQPEAARYLDMVREDRGRAPR